MDVEGCIGDFANGLNDGGSDRNIWHEMAVHYVNVDPVGSSFDDCIDIGAQ